MPGIPHQNGAAERKNHTFMNMVRSMLRSNELLLFLWSKTLKTIMYILNRISSKVVRKTQDQDNTSMNKDTWSFPKYIKPLISWRNNQFKNYHLKRNK
jgi:hypothetical protein